jgi:hypothetical protein
MGYWDRTASTSLREKIWSFHFSYLGYKEAEKYIDEYLSLDIRL